VSIGLPRQATLRRINSEKKEHLLPVEPGPAERRATSTVRPVTAVKVAQRNRANSTPPLYHPATLSAPAVPLARRHQFQGVDPASTIAAEAGPPRQQSLDGDQREEREFRPPRSPSITSSALSQHPELIEVDDKALIKAELDTKWILNLSMHFRDKSDREKFFVTYAETPTNWRRVTVSCDYRGCESGSLEMDLKELQFQRDKSLQIYESIRDSLPEIQFYDTVTNLKLETTDGRLHVHVTEDVNETIPYPPRSTVSHILDSDEYRPMEVPESALVFDSHLSGFVYKVSYDGKTYIKKEIPGPDTVDEFLYEINALHALHDCSNVIQLEAIVVDDDHSSVKGLLISYAERGAIVDLLYDFKGQIALEDRLRWGRDAVAGLSEIHEEGYVQGDFTLSNIVVDADNKAKIIDINRRGCPVGWEPPEIAVKIASHQRISMYIGEKSDLYQLGMTLWGLAADDDEPERHDPPVSVDVLPAEVPWEYKEVIKICLDPKPRKRKPARELLKLLPSTQNTTPRPLSFFPDHFEFREQKRYINPEDAVEREDIARFGAGSRTYSPNYSPASSKDRKSFTYPRSSNYQLGSETSEYDRPRGRAPPTNLEHLSYRERRGWSPQEMLLSPSDELEPQVLSVSPRQGPQYEEIELDGKPFLIARNTFTDEDLQILSHSRKESHAKDAADDESAMYNSHAPAGFSNSTLRSGLKVDDREETGAEAGTSTSAVVQQDCLTSRFSPSPNAHERLVLPSPQPPPSLTYADSGFHEPPDFDETLPLPHQPLPEQARKSSERQHAQTQPQAMHEPEQYLNEQPAQQFVPPTLERSDTSFKIPQEASASKSRGTETPKAGVAHNPVTVPLATSVDDDASPGTTPLAVLDNEAEPLSRESTPVARTEVSKAALTDSTTDAHAPGSDVSDEMTAVNESESLYSGLRQSQSTSG
jgi:serine/threonine protein kinase